MPDMMTELPNGFQRVIWKTEGYAFACPENAQFARFNHEGTLGILRLLVDVGDTRLRFSIECLPGDISAQAATEMAYEGADQAFQQENVPPTQVPRSEINIWRCRKRFVDGLAAPLIIDKAFLHTGRQLYSVVYTVAPIDYNKGIQIFETILLTFQETN